MLRTLLVCGSIALVTPHVVAQADRDPAGARQRRRTPVVEVVETCRDSVVNISTTRIVRVRPLDFGFPWEDIFEFGPRSRNRTVQSVGSGVIIHESGYIVTNAHVVSQASDVGVTFTAGQTLPADVVAVDAEHDLAILKVNAPNPLPAIRLGRSDDLMIGETIVAIGNPLGLHHTVTAGIISALDRTLEFGPEVVYPGLIQLDAPINPGNSGGPLININSELIGINTAIRGDAQDIGFAIPVDRLWELIPAMLDIEDRERVRFGLQVGGPDIQVLAVRPDSPAARAGLKPGDRLVTFNGDRLDNAIDYHVHLLDQKPDSRIKLAVQRGRDQLEVTVPLEPIPLPDGNALAERLFGLRLAEAPAELRRRYDLPAYVNLVVDAVLDNGPADYAGIEPGDFILRFDRVTVTTLKDVGLQLERVRAGERVRIDGLRLTRTGPDLWWTRLRAR